VSQGRVVLVGAGPGDPELITLRGLGWLRRAEVVVYDQLATPALLDEAPEDAVRIFAGKSAGRHYLEQSAINAILIHHARRGRLVVRLKGGDPFVFGRGGEEMLACARAGVAVEVVPGVSAAIAVPAAAGIPVTHRGFASSFAVVTGHEDPAKPESAVDWERLAMAAHHRAAPGGGAERRHACGCDPPRDYPGGRDRGRHARRHRRPCRGDPGAGRHRDRRGGGFPLHAFAVAARRRRLRSPLTSSRSVSSIAR